MKIHKLYYSCIVLLSIALVSNSTVYGHPDYSFKHYNINNGLSQNTVFAIFQDKQGFMWFGTKDGLNRFDGSAFRTFRFPPNDELADNVFKRIIQTDNEELWVATDDGVYIYNPLKESFSRFDAKTKGNKGIDGTISDMIIDDEGDVWISVEEKGVFHYVVSSQDLNFYEVPIGNEMKVITLCAGKNNDAWIFPFGQPFLNINKETGQVTQYELSDDEHLLTNLGEVSIVLADQYNNLILSTSLKGLVKINVVNRTHEIILDKDEHGNNIFVRTVLRADKNTLWVGSESGLYVYDEESGNSVNIKHSNSIANSLSDNAVYSIYKDRDNGIWVGTYFGGVNYYSTINSTFKNFYATDKEEHISGNRVREFCTAKHGNIWIGTEDAGLNLFNPKSDKFIPIDDKLKNLYTNIHALLNDGKYLWIGTFSRGLNRYDLEKGELTTYTQFDTPETINQNSVFALYRDEQNNLWIGTLSGVNVYDYNRDTFNKVNELTGLAIMDIKEDIKGNIWIGTFHSGIYKYNPATSKFTIYTHDSADKNSLPSNKITSIFEDSNKRLWITTQGGGFCYYESENNNFITYNSNDGLPNDVVYQIEEDNDNNLWLSTNLGLVCFSPKNLSFRSYTSENGLRTNQFNYKSSYKTTEGVMFFGSVDGFVSFNPSNLKDDRNLSQIVFTDLFLNNNQVTPDNINSPLEESIVYLQKLRLPYKNNSFSIRYALLNYSQQHVSHVRYKLEGFDKEWIKSGKEHVMVYSNLKPGVYKLIAMIDDGSDIGFLEKSLIIHVLPPLWLSIWAYLFYFVIIVIAVFLLLRSVRIREKRAQHRNMAIFEQEKERELHRSKIDFFTNVAHEIKSPLSLIKGPLEHVLITEQVSDNVRENLEIMSKNTERLLNLTNQLLDFRKTESAAYMLNLEFQNISEIIRQNYLRFTPLAKQLKMEFNLDLPEDDIIEEIDNEAFVKILSNLLSNALKYGKNLVNVKAFVIQQDSEFGELHVVTENDGDTIPIQYKDEIFKPFVHIDKKEDSQHSGTGIGLALSQSLAQLHNGNLYYELNNDLNIFHLVLPATSIKEKGVSAEGNLFQKKNTNKISSPQHPNTILLVDDDYELLGFQKKCLLPHYNILLANNGKEALEVLSESSVNLIVSDVMMPEMDGFEFTRHVKSNIEISHIPIILLTAKTNVQSKVYGLESGADAYIEKPFSIEVLMAQIANLLHNRDKLRETFINNPFIGASSVALTKSDEEFIKKLHTIVNNNLENSDLVVENIAEEFNMSRARFYRKIKGVLDLTPNEYIRVERLKKAALLLKEKEYKVNEICYMVGFNSPSYFSKCFQQQFGVLPKDFE